MSEKLDRISTSADHIDALADGKIDAKDSVKIENLKNEVHEKLFAAGDIFTKKDREHYLKRLQIARDTDSTELEALSTEIDSAAKEIQQKTRLFEKTVNDSSQYFGFNQKRSITETEQWIAAFKKQPLDKKREWIDGLKGRIEELKDLHEKAMALAPEQGDQINRLTEKEKKNFIAERIRLQAKTREFATLVENLGENFNQEELAQFKERFEDTTADEQDKFMDDFKKEAKTRNGLNEKFEEYPNEYSNLIPNFKKLRLDEKKAALERIDRAMHDDYVQQLFGKNTDPNDLNDLRNHLSPQSKAAALDWFVNEATPQLKGMALKLLKEQLKTEKALSDQYVKLIGELPNLSRAEKDEMTTAFLKGDFYRKKELIAAMENRVREEQSTHESVNKIDREYDQKLQIQLQNRVISQKTLQLEKELYAKMTAQEKAQRNREFDVLIKPRIQLKDRFEKEIPENIRLENSDFYDLSHQKRGERLEALLKIVELKQKDGAEKVKTGDKRERTTKELSPEQKQQVMELKLQATTGELNEDYSTAQDCYNAILTIDPEDAMAKERLNKVQAKLGIKSSDPDTQKAKNAAIDEEKQSADFKKQRRDFTIQKEVTKSAYLNELYNQGQVQSQKRDVHLNSAEKGIQERLYREKKMVLNKDGRAVKISNADLNRFEDLGENDKIALKEQLRKGQSYQVNFLNNHFQVTSDGQIISARAGLKKIDQQEKNLKDSLAKRVQGKLKEKGQILSAAESDALKQNLQTEKMDVDLNN